MKEPGSKDDRKKVVDLTSLTKRRSEQLSTEGNATMGAPQRSQMQDPPVYQPPPQQLVVPPMQMVPPPVRPPAQVVEQPSNNGFKRPRVRQRPRTDLPRQTFYVDPGQQSMLRYWAAVDARGISDIVRDALAMWLQQRELAEEQGEGT